MAFKLEGSFHLLTANYSESPNLHGESPKWFPFTLFPNINTIKVLAIYFTIK